MKNPMPQVRQFMTPAPLTVEADVKLSQVREMMRTSNVRHLPVKSGEKVIGVVSDRSLKSAIGFPDSDRFTAKDVMISDPFTVSPETPLDEVVAAMAEEKFGSVLVRDDDGVLQGIFTSIDACRALRQVLETFYPT